LTSLLLLDDHAAYSRWFSRRQALASCSNDSFYFPNDDNNQEEE
jgi:hypothetical protein